MDIRGGCLGLLEDDSRMKIALGQGILLGLEFYTIFLWLNIFGTHLLGVVGW